eukprot:4482015-Amphidinium_carterae.1
MGFAIHGMSEQLSLQKRDRHRLARKVTDLPRTGGRSKLVLQQVFVYSALVASVVHGLLGWTVIMDKWHSVDTGRAAVAQNVWSTCADVLLVRLPDEDIGVEESMKT